MKQIDPQKFMLHVLQREWLSAGLPNTISFEQYVDEAQVSKDPPKKQKLYPERISQWVEDLDIEKWCLAYPNISAMDELRKAVIWLQSNPAKRKTNFDSFFSNWCSNANERKGPDTVKKYKPI